MSDNKNQGLVNSFTEKGNMEKFDSPDDEFRVIYSRRKSVGWNFIFMGLFFLLAGTLVIIAGPLITPHVSETLVVGAVCLLTGLGLIWEGRTRFSCPKCLKKMREGVCIYCGFELRVKKTEEGDQASGES